LAIAVGGESLVADKQQLTVKLARTFNESRQHSGQQVVVLPGLGFPDPNAPQSARGDLRVIVDVRFPENLSVDVRRKVAALLGGGGGGAHNDTNESYERNEGKEELSYESSYTLLNT
jgi:DnaJ-class molecular chaperone